jgi:hypothetical protein
MLLEYAIGVAMVAAIVYAIAKSASGNRYARMTENEFEAEARRASSIGSAVAAVQKIVDPSHHVEYVQEENERLEADASTPGDKPQSGDPRDGRK